MEYTRLSCFGAPVVEGFTLSVHEMMKSIESDDEYLPTIFLSRRQSSCRKRDEEESVTGITPIVEGHD